MFVKYLVGGKCSANSVQSIVHSALCSQARSTSAAGHPTILPTALVLPVLWQPSWRQLLLVIVLAGVILSPSHLLLHSSSACSENVRG